MGNILKNVAKAAVTMFVVGGLLALAAPAIGGVLGDTGLVSAATAEAAKATSVMWTASFFGAFGALGAVITPAVNYVFNGFKQEQPEQPQVVVEKTPVVLMAVEKSHSQEKPCAKKFREAVIHERTAAQHDRSVM